MSSGGGYSGGMGGYGGGFGGGFGQPPQFGGGFGGGFGQPPQFGGGFGGGFGQPPQYGGGFGSPYGGFGGGFGQPQQFGGGFGQPQQSPFGGGSQGPMFQAQGPNTFGNAYAQRFQRPSVGMFPPTSPDPNQPPPGMELNPDYIDRFAGGRSGTLSVLPTDNKFRPIQQPQTGNPPPGMELNPDYIDRFANGQIDTADYRPSDERFRPIQQPQPQTGGDLQYRDAQFRPGGGPVRPAGSFLGGPYDPAGGYLGGYGGGYSSPYMSPSMMGGLASLFGGMQGGGFQGMFNPGFQQYPSNDQAARQQMALDQQRMESMIDRPQYQRNPNQPAADQPLAQAGFSNEYKDVLKAQAATPRYGTPEHRNSPEILQEIKRLREGEMARFLNLQSQSDDQIYNSLLQPVYAQ